MGGAAACADRRRTTACHLAVTSVTATLLPVRHRPSGSPSTSWEAALAGTVAAENDEGTAAPRGCPTQADRSSPVNTHRCGKHVVNANPASSIPIWTDCAVHSSGSSQIRDRFTRMTLVEFSGEESLLLNTIVEYAMLD